MLTIVIQAGGESRRMGEDKARLNFRGQPLILRVMERVARLADEILVTTNQPEAYSFLHVPCIPDLLPGRGALSGLFTALSVAQNPLVAVIACDMPFVSPELLVFQRDVLFTTSADAAIPRTPEGLEPFHAVYRKETCLPLVQAALEKGQRRVDSWMTQADIRYLTLEEIARYDPLGLAFLNINTPEDLQAAQRLDKEAR
jgi:molybdopterin-guanine dinucleotide biosynthesis protein A